MGLEFARDLGGLLRLCLCEFFLGIERITLNTHGFCMMPTVSLIEDI